MARGHSLAGVDGKRIRRQAGHMLVAGPGETRTFIGVSHDYLQFVSYLHFVSYPHFVS